MITTKRAPSRKATRAGKKRPAAKRAAPYHHGSLREAMLRAAESILERDGIGGLTLRAAAREAGVSHAAPKNHFGDIMGLLSDLAAVGFARFRVAMKAHIRSRGLEHVPSQLNQGDSLGAKDERVYRH